MKKKVQDAINEQICEEFKSAYIYLSMSAYFEAKNLKGFAHWLRQQWQEELVHALKFYDFLLNRGGQVTLKAIDQPAAEWGTSLEAFNKVLAHEQHITACIYKLYDIAEKEKDYALRTLLHWYIDEQVEEEGNATDIVEKLKLVGDSGSSLFLMDQQLGSRGPEAGEGEGEE